MVEVGVLVFRGYRDVVDADLADYLKHVSYYPLANEVQSNSLP